MDSIPNEMLDDPKDIIDNSIIGQRKLLEGYGGYKDTDQKKFKASVDPMHFAISLTGEGTLYPKLAEFIKLLHKQKKTTFLVTNGLHTDALKRLEDEDALPTQLYVSLDAPDEKLFKKIDCPQVKDAWKSLMKTMDFLKEVNDKTRTAIRITAIKNMNMENEEGYAEIINRADPLFIEVKSYMWVGSSQKRLDIKNMPLHGETREFAERIGKLCGYKIIDEKTNSRVILLAKSDFPGRIMKF
jgi:tRNA wybutosine-synthesizing protein 1